MGELYEEGLREYIPKLAERLGISEAAVRNLLHGELHSEICGKLDVANAALDCVFSEESEVHFDISEMLSMRQSDLDNLLDHYNNERKGFAVGLILGYLIGMTKD